MLKPFAIHLGGGDAMKRHRHAKKSTKEKGTSSRKASQQEVLVEPAATVVPLESPRKEGVVLICVTFLMIRCVFLFLRVLLLIPTSILTWARWRSFFARGRGQDRAT
ncbi:hypothetical protein TorRG33x02_303850 [Trema orientale]|uniref:Transmembrane protein n=1 Tax=Trema orientale TaxID=63057 RepID=A0A2P5BYS6_TREOI|nr:hypothetical protein TorRG33x02_303850 [Trema orientale]